MTSPTSLVARRAACLGTSTARSAARRTPRRSSPRRGRGAADRTRPFSGTGGAPTEEGSSGRSSTRTYSPGARQRRPGGAAPGIGGMCSARRLRLSPRPARDRASPFGSTEAWTVQCLLLPLSKCPTETMMAHLMLIVFQLHPMHP